MSRLLMLAVMLWASTAVGQDTLYYDKDQKQVSTLDSADYYTVIRQKGERAQLVSYYKSGKMKQELFYLNYAEGVLHGTQRKWYPDGKKEKEMSFHKGALNGKFMTYWSNGITKRIDNYEYGTWVDGKCFGMDSLEVPYFDYTQTASFPGGDSALQNYLNARQIFYPDRARELGIEGDVIVAFTVDEMGYITEIEVVQSVDLSLDMEVLKLVRDMPKWEPCKIDGVPVKQTFQCPIKFRLK